MMERRMTNDPANADDARWESGPDPDDPPWAGRRRTDEGSDPTDERSDPTDEDEGDRDDEPSDPASPDGEDPGPETHPAALAHVAPGMAPPRPPKRTGVFLDADDLREHVGSLLRAILGGYEVDAFGNFTFLHDNARIFVTVGPSPIGPQVGVFSVTNLGIDLTQELAAFLLTTNHRLGFGSFSYDPENEAVWLRHALLGTTLDGPELQAAVAAVASTAAAYDDRIRDRFGGRTFTEAPSDVQRRMEPPEPSQDGPPNAGGYL
jgi:hypothetical protein